MNSFKTITIKKWKKKKRKTNVIKVTTTHLSIKKNCKKKFVEKENYQNRTKTKRNRKNTENFKLFFPIPPILQ